MGFVVPATTRLLCGKQLSMLYRNPGTGAASTPACPQEMRIDEFAWTPKVNSAKYADSLSSGYVKSTSGVFEADGSFNINLTAEGSVANTGAAGVGCQVDDIIDVQVFTTLALRLAQTPSLYAQIHINSVSKPFKTMDQKIACKVDFTMEGIWTEA